MRCCSPVKLDLEIVQSYYTLLLSRGGRDLYSIIHLVPTKIVCVVEININFFLGLSSACCSYGGCVCTCL